MKIRQHGTNQIYFKDHLQRLPLVSDLVTSYPTSSEKMIILVPLFSFKESQDDMLDYLIPSIIYQRRSFELHSDIIEQGVGIKPYIPENIYPSVRDMLIHAGYTDEDVILYEDTNTAQKESEGYFEPFGARFLFLDDNRFNKYEYILVVDSDLFLAKSTRLGKDDKFPLVEKLSTLPKTTWYVTHTDHTWNMKEEGPRGNWERRVKYDSQKWYEKAKEFIGYDVQHIETMLSSDQSMVLYPTEYLNTGFRETLQRGINILQDDEAFTALWTLDNPYPDTLNPIIENLNLTYLVEQYDDTHDFYIAHLRTGWEQKWRQQIGAFIEE